MTYGCYAERMLAIEVPTTNEGSTQKMKASAFFGTLAFLAATSANGALVTFTDTQLASGNPVTSGGVTLTTSTVGGIITFIATSADVLHGLNLERTRVNMMLIPGQVSRTVHTFDEPGEYMTICHEYCGVGHHYMNARVVVE